MEHFLLAIIPSEDITIHIRKIRTAIFQKFGIISSRCLPEMIPVAFSNEIINKNKFQGLTLEGGLKSSNIFATDTGNIFLKVDNNNFINKITKNINSNIIPGIFPTAEGFYLNTIKHDSDIVEIIQSLKHKFDTNLTWKKNYLELIKIETFTEIWWENVRWETIWKKKINLL